jgi:hypothetical protein
VCRRCPFCGPSGECLDPALKSGRCGDWIWWVLHGKQIRRPYFYPRDPRSPAQLRSRARFSAASGKYSDYLTEKQRNACITAGAKRRSRPRLGQSGPLTGQQYSIRKEYALQKAHGKAIKGPLAPQVAQPQRLNPTSSDPHRGATGAPPDRHRRGARPVSRVHATLKKAQRPQVQQHQRLTALLKKDSEARRPSDRALPPLTARAPRGSGQSPPRITPS